MRTALLVPALFLLPGCLTGGGANGPGESSSPTIPAGVIGPWQVLYEHRATSCQETVLVALLDFDRAQSSLPPGWVAGDAQLMLGTPAPLGRSAVWVVANLCDLGNATYDEGGVAVLVEPPSLGDYPLDPGRTDLYFLKAYTTYPPVQAALNQMAFDHSEGSMAADAGSLGPISAVASGSLADADGEIASWSGPSPTGPEFVSTTRLWQQTPTGLAVLEYEVGTPIRAGVATACTFRAGSVAAAALPGVSCPSEETLLVAVPELAETLTIRFLPGFRIS